MGPNTRRYNKGRTLVSPNGPPLFAAYGLWQLNSLLFLIPFLFPPLLEPAAGVLTPAAEVSGLHAQDTPHAGFQIPAQGA